MVKIKSKNRIKNRSLSSRLLNMLNGIVLIFVTLLCLFPILNILATSLSSQAAVSANRVTFYPVEFTLASYETVIHRAAFWTASWISVKRVILGVIINVVITVMMAYPLSRPVNEFPMRKVYVGILMVAMVFDGGLVPNYLMVHSLGLFDTIWALVLPCSVKIFHVILMMNFIKQLPGTMLEAAKVDGASHMTVLTRIVIPVSKPVLATVTLFSFIDHWNAWFDGKIYNNNSANYPLQTYLQAMLSNVDNTVVSDSIQNILTNTQTLEAAQMFLTLLPLLVVYPFLQKYFVKGITIGAVKG